MMRTIQITAASRKTFPMRMAEFLNARLDAHGVARDARLRRALLEPDVALNVQGLEVWLERRRHAR